MENYTLTIALNSYGSIGEIKEEYEEIGDVRIEDTQQDLFRENSFFVMGTVETKLSDGDPFKKTKEILESHDIEGTAFTCRKGKTIMFTDEHNYF